MIASLLALSGLCGVGAAGLLRAAWRRGRDSRKTVRAATVLIHVSLILFLRAWMLDAPALWSAPDPISLDWRSAGELMPSGEPLRATVSDGLPSAPTGNEGKTDDVMPDLPYREPADPTDVANSSGKTEVDRAPDGAPAAAADSRVDADSLAESTTTTLDSAASDPDSRTDRNADPPTSELVVAPQPAATLANAKDTIRATPADRQKADAPPKSEEAAGVSARREIDAATFAALQSQIAARVEAAGGKPGRLTFSLGWGNFNDLDLHVVTPSGERIYFAHEKSECGGELDVDMNVSPRSPEPVENIVWAESPPRGKYRVIVRHFKNHGLEGCDDPTPFVVRIRNEEGVRLFSGSARSNSDVDVAEISVGPKD